MSPRLAALASALLLVSGCAIEAADVASSSDELGSSCGGRGAAICASNEICVDDPTDRCDPDVDPECLGVCRASGAACDYSRRSREYVSNDPAVCAATTFFCAEPYTMFFDECGCGCERPACGVLCIEGSRLDARTCTCVPRGRPIACGDRACGGDQVCCNDSCGICTAPGEGCIQIACLDADRRVPETTKIIVREPKL